MSQLLRNEVLTGLIRKIKPARAVAGSAFFGGGNWTPNMSDLVTVDQVTGSEGIVNYRDPDAAAGVQSGPKVGQIMMPLMTIREKVAIRPSERKWLRRPGADQSEYGRQLIVDRLTELRNKVERRLELTRWDILKDGIATLPVEDANGSVINHTANFNVPAGHIIDVSGSAPWSAAGTSILTQLEQWNETVERGGVYGPITDAYLSRKTLNQYMRKNDEILALMSDATKDQLIRGSVINFNGVNWHVFDAGYRSGEGLEDDPFVGYINQGDGENVIFKSGGAVGREFTAPVPDNDAPDGQTGMFVKTYDQKDPSVTWIVVVVTVLPALTHPKDILVAKVAA